MHGQKKPQSTWLQSYSV